MASKKSAEAKPMMRGHYDKRKPHPASTHVPTAEHQKREKADKRGKSLDATAMYQMDNLDSEAREDEEERLEKEEQARIKRHKNKMKGDGTISGRYMRKTFLQYDDGAHDRKSVKLRDAKELNKENRIREIRDVKSLMIEDETESMDKLPECITEITHIDELVIKYCRTKALPNKITNLKEVTTLTLNETHLKDMEIICKLTSLRHLNVSHNLLKHIPAAIGNLVVLETLNLNGNHIQVLPSQIGNLNNLLALSVASNKLHHLPDSLCKLANLRNIDASRNVIESIPEDIGQLSSLITLNVGYNKLDYMPESLRSMRKLKFLYAPRNRLFEIGDGFTDLVALENLHLQENKISQISGCPPNAAVLLVNDNLIKDASLLWRALRKIRTLSLRSNQIKELPDGVMAGAASIRCLYLDDNPIQFLPDQLSQNIQLCHLTISGTQIPHIPHGILHLPKLTLIEARDCKLDPTLQIAATRGVDDLRKAYDNFIPEERPQISAVQLRRNSSKLKANGTDHRSSGLIDGQEKRSSWRPPSTNESTLKREEARNGPSKLAAPDERKDEKRGSRILKEGTIPRDNSNAVINDTSRDPEKKSPRGQDSTLTRDLDKKSPRDGQNSTLTRDLEKKSPRESTLPRDPEKISPRGQEVDTNKRLPRTVFQGQDNVKRETNNNIATNERPRPATKPKPPTQAKPVTAEKPQPAQKPTTGGQKTSFLFSRPT